MNLPKDPMLLLSVVNTKLRDQYTSLDALCEDMQADRERTLITLTTKIPINLYRRKETICQII